jgi:hypothetical protein
VERPQVHGGAGRRHLQARRQGQLRHFLRPPCYMCTG